MPTPRVTPVEVKTSGSARANRLSNPASDAPIKQDLNMVPLSQTPLGTNDIAATIATPIPSQTMPIISSTPMNATIPFSQTPYTMQMSNMSPISPQMNPLMMAQYMMMMMNSSNYPYNAQTQPTDFNSALIDALRNHNVQWPTSQPAQESPPQSNMHDHQAVGLTTDQDYHAFPKPSSNLFPDSDSQSTRSEVPIRKKRRASNVSSDSLPMQDLMRSDSLKSKGKSKSISPAPKRHKASSSATQFSSERKLFHDKSGKELSFFVQVEMHNRSRVVTAIKVKYIPKMIHTSR